MNLMWFHSDILKHILTFLPSGNDSVLRFVCPRFRQVITPVLSTCYDFVPYDELFDWAYAKGCPCDAKTIGEAIKQGKLNIIKRHEEAHPKPFLVALSIQHGQLHILQWMYDNKYVTHFSDHLFRIAASFGHLEIVKWMYGINAINSSDLNHDIAQSACREGHLHILEWLATLGYEFNKRSYWEVAAQRGHTHLLKWFASKGISLSNQDSLCTLAGYSGNLETLQYLRQQGCDWNVSTNINAALNNHFSLLKWAVEQGCPLNTDVLNYALQYSSVEMITYLYDHNCPHPEKPYAAAMFRDQPDKFKCLHQRGIPITIDDVILAIIYDRVLIMEWMLQNNFPWDNEKCLQALNDHAFSRMRYLVEKKSLNLGKS
jgi:hypothetical protein